MKFTFGIISSGEEDYNVHLVIDSIESLNIPEYEVLDRLLDIYIEKNGDASEIIKAGFDRDLVDRVISMVDRAEYKRRQYPPGPKISSIAFGKDRRLPMTSRWKER